MMKKTLLTLLVFCGFSVATAAVVESEENYHGNSILHNPTNPDSFAITFEIANISLEDIAGQTPFFTWEMQYSDNKNITVQALYGNNGYWSLYINGSIGNYIAQSQEQLISDAPGTYVFQFQENGSDYQISLGKVDMGGDIVSLVSSAQAPAWGTPFGEAYSNMYGDLIMNGGSFTINTVNAASATIQNVKTWNGNPTGAEIIEANKPVPEPTAVTLSLLTLCGMAARRRRK